MKMLRSLTAMFCIAELSRVYERSPVAVWISGARPTTVTVSFCWLTSSVVIPALYLSFAWTTTLVILTVLKPVIEILSVYVSGLTMGNT
jgi:hypothetical protein